MILSQSTCPVKWKTNLLVSKDKLKESQPSKKELGKERLTPGKDVGTWLGAGLAALYGPQQNHPWVQILHSHRPTADSNSHITVLAYAFKLRL